MAPFVLAAFLLLFATQTLWEGLLIVLNLRQAQRGVGPLPPLLAAEWPAGRVVQSQAYTLARGRLELLQHGVDAVLLLALLLSGLLPTWDGWLAALGLQGAQRFVAFLVGVAVLLGLAGLPFSLYRTFGLEARFGFNRTKLRLWLLDRLKGLALAALLGLPLLYAVYGFMAWTGRAWWLWLLAFLTAVQIGLVWLYPTWIAPWFNRFVPLPAGEMRQRLEALAQGAGFRPRGIYVVDASRRSGHSNAYFTGFFRPRIVLFDTLLQRMGLEEALAVLAHEMGHYQKRHIHKALLLNLAGQAVSLLVLQWAVRWPPLFQAFGFAGPTLHAGLALLLLAGGSCTFFLSPLWAWFSRRNEYAADAYAISVQGQPQALKAALLRLSQDNLANLAPHPWYSFYHYSHPTLVERLAAIDRIAPSLAPRPPETASA